MNYYINTLTKNYANFKGRARRKEYWMFILVNVIVALILAIIAVLTKIEIIPTVYSLIILIPTIAIVVRRLHDIGKSGAWLLISLIPIAGGIWLLVLMCQEGNSKANMYGENPKKRISRIS